MARIVFLQDIWFEFMGPMHISAVLKAAGHECDLLIGRNASDFLGELRRIQPDVVAFSVMTGSHSWVAETGKAIKSELGCLVVCGGPHVTFFPEFVEQDGVDAICRGEGEGALLDIAAAVDSGADLSGIANLWVKLAGGNICRNDVRPLIDNLDVPPWPDRQLYQRYPLLAGGGVTHFLSSRGCPFDCSFCFNHRMMELYRGKGAYVRHRSPASMVSEIESVVSGSTSHRVYFADDTFALNKQWLRDFLPVYKVRVGLPFHCLVRISQVDEEIASLLAATGCAAVFWGVESGDERTRTELLDKGISDCQIRQGAALLKKHSLPFRTYNIVGFPGESMEQAMKTLRLNIEIGTDYPWCSLFTPYPGTRLEEYARQGGYLVADSQGRSIGRSFHGDSLLKNPEGDRIINLHKFFQTAVAVPCLLPLVKLIIRLPPNALFQLWFSLVYFLMYLRSEGRSVSGTLPVAIRNAGFFRRRR